MNWSTSPSRASNAFDVNSVVLVPSVVLFSFNVSVQDIKYHFIFVQNSPKRTRFMLRYPAARLSPRAARTAWSITVDCLEEFWDVVCPNSQL